MRFPLLITSFIFTLSLTAQQIIFEENFNNGIPASWYLVNTDNLTPAAAVDTFDNAWIPFINGDDTCAASTSFYNPSGQSADYIITPRMSLDSYSKLIWSARSFDASYPDGYLVLISVTDSLVGSFTDTLYSKAEELAYWRTRSVQLDLEGYANQDVFIAFKNITNDGFILMLDNVKVESSNFLEVESGVGSEISVYPNPATDYIQINGYQPGNVTTIYNASGNQILSSVDSRIDISQLPSALYFYTVTTGDSEISSGKFVKN